MFTRYGTMTKCGVIYDEMGYSTKTARIEFQEPSSALKSIEELNEAEIEGVKMNIQVDMGSSGRSYRDSRDNRDNRNNRIELPSRGGRIRVNGEELK